MNNLKYKNNRENESDNLDKRKILKKLKYKHNIEIFDRIESTNKYLKSNIEKKEFGTIVISNEQTGGYGKNGRKFVSEKNKGIYMSIFVNPNCSIQESLKLTILTSVAIWSAIKSLYNIEVQLKWVNDIIFNRLKIGGILCETQVNLNSKIIDAMVVGIGLNVKENTFYGNLDNIATSIENYTDMIVSRNDLISEIINFFDKYFYEKQEYMEIYKKNSCVIGKTITVHQNNTNYEAKALDIDENGALIIKKENEIIKLQSSDITIRY